MATLNASTNSKKYVKVKFGSGDDTITLEDGNFNINTGKGNDIVTLGSGNSIVKLNSGENTVNFGEGNSKVYAGKGSDEFVFDTATGSNIIYNSSSKDSITFGTYYDDLDLKYYRMGKNLVITDDILSPDNTVTLSKFFKNKSKLDSVTHDGVEEKISDQLIYYSGKGKIKGTSYNDALYGSDKKDTLYGYAGDDYLVGGKLNDKIYSGTGENHIIVNNGDGHDALYVNKKATSNTLVFDEGNNLTYSKSGKDLVVSAAYGTASADDPNNVSVTIKNYFTKDGDTAIKNELYTQFIGSEEETNLVTSLREQGVTITGKINKKNTLYGAEDYDNYITGGDKADKIYAGEANNRIYGGKGNDKYYVEDAQFLTSTTKIFDIEGNDTYTIDDLDSSIYIQDDMGKDTLKIKDNLRYTMFFDVSVNDTVAEYNSLFIVDNDNIRDMSIESYTAGGIEIGNFFTSSGEYGAGRIEKITVGGKTVDTSLTYFDTIRDNVAAWLSANDYDSAMLAFKSESAEDIQELIAIYQGAPVNIG